MKIVSVALPLPLKEPLLYTINRNESVLFKRVLVPLRGRRITGIVVEERVTEEQLENIRPVIEVLDEEPLFSEKDFEFYRFISHHYFTPLGIVLKYSLPGWTTFKAVRIVKLKRHGALPEEVEEYLSKPRTVKSLKKRFPSIYNRLRNLAEEGIIEIKEHMRGRLSPSSFPEEEVKKERIRLKKEQREALDKIVNSLNSFSTFLLYGPPASGKTEIYIEAIKKVTGAGKNAIVLVPEILLATHLLERYRKRLGRKVLPFHSGLSQKERAGILLQTKKGGYVIIGPKSLIIAPIPKPGIVVVDEEHDLSYKSEGEFPYQARDIAVKKGEIFNIPVVLGTATPSVESWFHLQTGKYKLLRLRHRYIEEGGVDVHLVKISRRKGILSEELKTEISHTLREGKQSILLLNRRGYSSFMICKFCGWIIFCERCSVAMNYHRRVNRLICHYCGYTQEVPSQCARCGNEVIKHAGWGTEKLEEAIKEIFPNAKVLRIDRDEIGNWQSLREKLLAFEKKEYDILIGTQMVGKGLDMPEVKLVGVVLAENAFLFPDFRAGEKTFSLLTQVVGRGGRREKGKAIIQSYNIHHPAIEMAVKKSVEDFLNEEIERRKERRYPPFVHLCLIQVSHKNFQKAKESAEKIKEEVRNITSVKGPTPSHIMKLRNLYRWSLLLYNEERNRIKEAVEKIQSLNLKARITIDPDPVSFS